MIDLGELTGALRLTGAQMALFVLGAALTTGLTNVVKALARGGAGDDGTPIRWLPLAALLIGVIVAELCALVAQPPVNWLTALLVGLVLGLMSSGLWAQVKTLSGRG